MRNAISAIKDDSSDLSLSVEREYSLRLEEYGWAAIVFVEDFRSLFTVSAGVE